jgi:uncharacterized protein (TIGR02001 family)
VNLKNLAFAVSALVVCGSVAAELSANIGATSNYVWRGVTQTDNSAAISGGLDYGHDSGFYVGTWASNVDFNGASAEVDFYGGFANEINGFGYDLGAIYYYYPGAEDLGDREDEIDFAEIYAGLSFGPVSGGINYTVYKENRDLGENDVYYYLSAGAEVAPTWSLGGTVGYYDFKGGAYYSHGQLDVTKSVGDFGDFTLSVSTVFSQKDDLDLDKDPLVSVSWAKTF